MLSLFILVPLAAVILLNILRGKIAGNAACALGIFLSVVQACVIILHILLPAAVPYVPFTFLASKLAADGLSVVMLLLTGIVTATSLMIGRNTFTDEEQKFNFANLVILTLAGMNGVLLVTDLFSLYVYIEIVAVASFILITLYRDKPALEGAFKYIVLSVTASVFILLSISVILLVSGDTSFSSIRSGFANPANGLVFNIALCCFACGLFTKGGLVPFHSWLPDAHSSAPTSVSILLSGIVIKVSGLYPLIRLVTLAGGGFARFNGVLLFIGIVSIYVGALAALGQRDMKRMLAFSSVSQMGYVVLSIGTGTTLGIIGAVFHLFNHAVFKSQLFANSAAVEKQTGTRDMDKLGGLAGRMPFTGGSSVVGMLSISGIPPLSGFWSKLIIIIALWQTAHYFCAFAAVIASVITLAYFLSLQRRVFFGKIAKGLENIKEAKTGLVLPAVLLALITISVGLFFPFVLNKFIIPAGYILK